MKRISGLIFFAILVHVPCFADEGIVFTTLRCGNPTPPDVVIYSIEGRYPTVTELLDFADGEVHQIELRVAAGDSQANHATIEFLLAHGLGINTPYGDCDSPQECKTKIESLCSSDEKLCTEWQPTTGIDEQTGAKTCSGYCCNKQSGELQTGYTVYCFKVQY